MTSEVGTPTAETAWHTISGPDVTAALDSDAEIGLSTAEAQRRLDRYGPNSIPKEPPPSYLQVLLKAHRGGAGLGADFRLLINLQLVRGGCSTTGEGRGWGLTGDY